MLKRLVASGLRLRYVMLNVMAYPTCAGRTAAWRGNLNSPLTTFTVPLTPPLALPPPALHVQRGLSCPPSKGVLRISGVYVFPQSATAGTGDPMLATQMLHGFVPG